MGRMASASKGTLAAPGRGSLRVMSLLRTSRRCCSIALARLSCSFSERSFSACSSSFSTFCHSNANCAMTSVEQLWFSKFLTSLSSGRRLTSTRTLAGCRVSCDCAGLSGDIALPGAGGALFSAFGEESFACRGCLPNEVRRPSTCGEAERLSLVLLEVAEETLRWETGGEADLEAFGTFCERAASRGPESGPAAEVLPGAHLASISLLRRTAASLAPSMPSSAGEKSSGCSRSSPIGYAVQPRNALSQTTPSHGLVKEPHVSNTGAPNAAPRLA
mmetsp:Transcript_105647/g.251928  ORF Transcript_105647/g.251928 Transcript_105647/m.251928 type:complete len:275 (-) Transcript_105647:51-875(-)